jgi:hypothetical protein
MVVAAFIIALLALLVGMLALPTVFQMIWGRPKITLESWTTNLKGGLLLECNMWNEPINNKLLKTMRVYRMPAHDITAYIEIKQAGTNKIKASFVPRIRSLSGAYAQRISLAASPLRVSFLVVYRRHTDGIVKVNDEDKSSLDVGKYEANIGVIVDYKPIREQWAFVVSKQEPYLYWS